MQVEVNGNPQELPNHSTLSGLLEQLAIKSAHVAVEVNGELVPREQHSSFKLAGRDTVEIVTLVGGG